MHDDHRPTHHTIAVVDVEGYGDPRRTNPDRLAVRDGLYRVLRTAYGSADISWEDCYHDDSGDSVLTLAPASVPKSVFVEQLPALLVAALAEHNAACRTEERIRLRMALHAGEVTFDEHGLSSAAVILACRLVNAAPAKAALKTSPGVLALLVSNWFFDDVVRHCPGAAAATYRPVHVHEKELTTIGWLALPDYPYPPDAAQLATAPTIDPDPLRRRLVPRQLPLAVRDFTGRAEQLAALDALLPAESDSPAVVISAVDGAAGIGKTTLAVHWAHRVQHRFPDGTLHANLRGYGPGDPASPDEVLDGFLRALDIPAERIPADLDARSALFRSVLADRRVLIVLDNANGAGQVRPLLSATPGCMVLITSRESLTGLVVTEAAHRLTLDLLTPAEAHTLVTTIIGAEADQVEDLVRLCARLPLALRIAAGRIATHRHLTVADVVDELTDEHDRVEALSRDTDERAAVRAVFDWSYQQLTPEQARVFRRLGLHPGADISLHAAATLAGTTPTETRRLMDRLTAVHMIEPITRDRYRFHDLLRAYAVTLAAQDSDSAAARTALLDWYIEAAHTCNELVFPYARPAPLPPLTVTHPLPVANRDEAWKWMRNEYRNIITVIQHTVVHDLPQHTMHLAMNGIFIGYFISDTENLDIYESGLAAAQACGDRSVETRLRVVVGISLRRLHRWEEAEFTLMTALGSARELGDPLVESSVMNDLATLHNDLKRFDDALSYLNKALPAARGNGPVRGRGRRQHRHRPHRARPLHGGAPTR